MTKRYELSEAQWAAIKDLLPGKVSDVGRTAKDNLQFMNGCLWVIRSGAPWCDMPERYGKWKSVHKRFTRWAKAGVWERVFAALLKDKKNEYLVVRRYPCWLKWHQTLSSLLLYRFAIPKMLGTGSR